jgi:hypothetical protein
MRDFSSRLKMSIDGSNPPGPCAVTVGMASPTAAVPKCSIDLPLLSYGRSGKGSVLRRCFGALGPCSTLRLRCLADVAELVYAPGLGPGAERHGGSSPPVRTHIVVYVSPRGEVDIVLEVQLGVVIALEDWATIRFIDEFEEAIDGGQDHQPVRDGGVLVGLGEVSDGTTSARVVADRYEQADELVSFDLTLHRSGGEWTVDEPIEGTHVNLR